MIVGNPGKFAIESEITHAYARLSLRALGFFVIYITGRCYGVKDWDATMLANSFDEVGRRIARRGNHKPPFAMDANGDEVAYSIRRALYDQCAEGELFFGIPVRQFREAIDSNHIEWAPDGDEAFDDHSYMLQLEDENQVRLVAFKSTADSFYPTGLREVWLPQDEFYGILQEWYDRFKDEWTQAPKVSSSIQ
jgi:hypothetical protein